MHNKINKLLLGVTGSVAAIKTPELATKLAALAALKLIPTQNALYFIRDINQAQIPILQDQDEWPPYEQTYPIETPILHIELRRFADMLIIAPLDANTLAKISHGLCDNLLTSLVRAWDYTKPLVLCPAMNTLMWENPLTAKQLAVMEDLGATIIPPIFKTLACQDVGMGGMAEVDEIVYLVSQLLR